jgi:hypothetical protein
MPPASLHIHRSGDTGEWTFELPTVPQPAFMVAVDDEGADQPVWWLVSEAFTEVLRHSDPPADQSSAPSREEDPSAYSEQLIARGVAPNALLAARTVNRPLKSLVYGSAPRGFRQTLPPSHPPGRLAVGNRYTITVLGSAGVVIAQASFLA